MQAPPPVMHYARERAKADAVRQIMPRSGNKDQQHFSLRRLLPSRRKESGSSHGARRPVSAFGSAEQQHSSVSLPTRVHSASSSNVDVRLGNKTFRDDAVAMTSNGLMQTASNPNVATIASTQHTPHLLSTSVAKNLDGSPITITDIQSEGLAPPVDSISSDIPSVLVEVDLSIVADSSNSPGRSSFWDQAYISLLSKNDDRSQKLLQRYEKVLVEKLPLTSNSSDHPKSNEAYRNLRGGGRQSVSIFDPNQRYQQVMTMLEKSEKIHEIKGKIFIGDQTVDIRSLIAKAAEGAKFAKDLIDQAVKASPEASVIWSAVCLVLPLLTRPVEVEAANHDGLEYVSSRMQFYISIEDLLFPSRMSMVQDPARMNLSKSLVLLYEHILDFQIRSIVRSCDGHWYDDIFSENDWSGMRSKIENLESIFTSDSSLINSNRLQELLRSANEAQRELKQLYTQGIRILEALKADHTKLVTNTEQTNHHLQKIHEDKQQNQSQVKINTCLQELLRGSSYKDFFDGIPGRVEGTCCWFLSQTEYKSWLMSTCSCLLVTADPGCGKSVLAKHLIENELRSFETIVCYFFFKDQVQNTFAQALAALLHQLLKHRRDMAEQVMEFYDENPEKFSTDSTALSQALSKILIDPKVQPVIFVLDALDECKTDDLEKLFDWIAELQDPETGQSRHKFLLTSRPYGQIDDDFGYHKTKMSQIRIQGHESSKQIIEEVKIVIKYRCKELLERKRIGVDVHDELLNRLLSHENYTYLFVYLIFTEIGRQERLRRPTMNTFQKWFSRLPQSVDNACEKMLSKYTSDPDIKSTVQIILQIMVAAFRPLTLTELQWAVMIEEERPSSHQAVDVGSIEDFKSKLQSWCGLLVQVREDKVTFLHQTVRDFLVLKEGSVVSAEIEPTMWAHSVNEKDAQALLGRICMAYLLLPDLAAFQDSFFSLESVPETLSGDQEVLSPSIGGQSHEFGNEETLEEDDSNEGLGNPQLEAVPSRASEVDTNSLVSKPKKDWENEWSFDQNQRRTILSKYPFLEYAADRWDEHLVKAECDEDEDEGILASSLTLWNDTTATFSTWAKASTYPYSRWTQHLSEPFDEPQPLTVAAASASHPIFAHLLKNTDLSSDPKVGEAALLTAIKYGLQKNAILLLDSGVNPNCCDRKGRTALCSSISPSKLSVVECLLKHGVEIDVDSLHTATTMDDMQFLTALLQHEQDIDAVCSSGYTALYHAASAGRIDAVRNLLNSKANPNKQNTRGYTALIIAAYKGHFDTTQLLMEANADPDTVDNDGDTALTCAARRGHYKIANTLLSYKSNVKHCELDGCTALHLAARNGHTDIVEALLENESFVDARTKYGSTALRLAAHFGHHSTVALLLQHKADLDITDNDGDTALISACRQGHLEVVDILLRHHADVNKTTLDGSTGLYYASGAGHVETVNSLLKNRAMVDIYNDHGNTSLSLAACHGHTSVAELLLEHNADPNILDADDDNALMCAALHGHPQIVELLLKRGAEISSGVLTGRQNALHSAAEETKMDDRSPAQHATRAEDYIQTMELLINAGQDINLPDSNGTTPLMLAASRLHDHRPILEYMLKVHANINAIDENGQTCIHYVYNEEALEALSGHQPDLNVQDLSGRTPLLHLMLSPTWAKDFDRLTDLYHAMVKRGASLDIPDQQGLCPPRRLNGRFSTSSETIKLEHKVALEAVCRDGSGEGRTSTINLDDYIGVKDGLLVWTQDGNFSTTARDIKLGYDNRILQAEVPGADGIWKLAYIWLDERIENVEGVLRFQSSPSSDQ